MPTQIDRSSEVVSVASRLYPLLTQLKDAKTDVAKITAALERIASTIEADEEMKARPGLLALVTPTTDPTALPAIPTFFSMATSADVRATYVKGVLDRLMQEVNAPEGGRRRRKTRRSKGKTRRTTKPRRR